MAKNDKTAAQKVYCDLMAAGKGHKAALEASGLSAYWAAFAWYADSRNANRVEGGSVKLPTVPPASADGHEVALRRAGLVVAELRAGLHPSHKGTKLSWGQIAVVCNVPEGQVRRAFKAATGLSSQGQRKGHGGRYLAGEPRFYSGNRKGIGVEAEAPRRLDPNKVAAEAENAKTVLPQAVAKVRKQLAASAKRRTATPKA